MGLVTLLYEVYYPSIGRSKQRTGVIKIFDILNEVWNRVVTLKFSRPLHRNCLNRRKCINSWLTKYWSVVLWDYKLVQRPKYLQFKQWRQVTEDKDVSKEKV